MEWGTKRKGRKKEGITLAGSGSWVPAKIKKEGKRKQNRGFHSPLRDTSRNRERENEAEREKNSYGEDRKRLGV